MNHHIALLGCGFAADLHAKTFGKLSKEVTFSFASRTQTKADAFQKKYGGELAFGDYQSAINHPDISTVLILTPPVQHLDLTLQALEAGKHVIVEKPPFLSSSDFDIVEKTAQKQQRLVMVAENYFYKPVLNRLRQIIHDGRIGTPLFVHLNAIKKQSTNDWRDELSLSGGDALFEGGIHWISFLNHLGWSINRVGGYIPDGRGNRNILIGFDYLDGPAGHLSYSWDVPSLFKGLRVSRIYGDKGSILFESNGVFIGVRGPRPLFTFPGFGDITGYKGMFEDFFEAIAENRQPRFTLEMARKDLETIEKIKQSQS